MASDTASNVSRTQRLFLALWPDATVRSQLEASSRALPLLGGRLVAARNFHVTLVFLGLADSLRRACIEQAAAAVHAAPFEFELTEAQWRPRTGIVWVVGHEVPPMLNQLAASLNSAMAGCGHAAEPRPFRLHVTVARNVRRAERRRPLAPIHWRAERFCLVSSVTGPQGSEYTVERDWALR